MNTFQIIVGHFLSVAKKIPDASVHSVITSPPYWHLRNYKTRPQVWDARPGCKHRWKRERQYQDAPIRDGDEGVGFDEPATTKKQRWLTHSTCTKCKAWRGELGQEPTPELYIKHMLQVMKEVWRVLRPDGTLWLDIGDSYCTTAPGTKMAGSSRTSTLKPNRRLDAQDKERARNVRPMTPAGMKPGDLVGIPWMLALALRQAGWYLRRDHIWHKTACMPESVQGWRWERCRHKVKPSSAPNAGGVRGHNLGEKDGHWTKATHPSTRTPAEYVDCPGCKKCEATDGLILRKGAGRCTTSHEYIFMLAKSESYFYDSDAISEPVNGSQVEAPRPIGPPTLWKEPAPPKCTGGGTRKKQDGDSIASSLFARRNKRSVWTLSPEPYDEDHFAAFPSELPSTCIKAATSEHGCCARCGAPYARVIEREGGSHSFASSAKDNGRQEQGLRRGSRLGRGPGWREAPPQIIKTIGWRRTCSCKMKKVVPAVVLDPFLGRGTTGVAAVRHGRNFIGCELQEKYVPMARKNLEAEAPLYVKEIK